jgi:hypothetical protein
MEQRVRGAAEAGRTRTRALNRSRKPPDSAEEALQALAALHPDADRAAQNEAVSQALANPSFRVVAKAAIAAALLALECDDVKFWLAGVRRRQLEPSWERAVDRLPWRSPKP